MFRGSVLRFSVHVALDRIFFSGYQAEHGLSRREMYALGHWTFGDCPGKGRAHHAGFAFGVLESVQRITGRDLLPGDKVYRQNLDRIGQFIGEFQPLGNHAVQVLIVIEIRIFFFYLSAHAGGY